MNKSILLSCFLLVLATGCGKQSSVKNEISTPQQAEQKPKQIIVKGLYVGMPISAVAAVVREKFGSDWEVDTSYVNSATEKGVYIFSQRVRQAQKQFTMDDGVAVKCDDQGNVISIGFTPPAVDALFNAYDLQPEQFLQTFIDSYGIPKMEGVRGGWEFIQDDLKVGIGNNKVVILERVASQKEIQKNFN